MWEKKTTLTLQVVLYIKTSSPHSFWDSMRTAIGRLGTRTSTSLSSITSGLVISLSYIYNRRSYNLLDVALIQSLVFHGLYERTELNNSPSPASLWPSTPCSSSTLPQRTFSDRTTRCWSSSPSRASSSSPTGRWVAGRLVPHHISVFSGCWKYRWSMQTLHCRGPSVKEKCHLAGLTK